MFIQKRWHGACVYRVMRELEEIKIFADRAHGAQMRKYSPERYIVHPIRVMALCRNYTNDITILAAALLHDVLEDTTTTAEEIESFLKPLLGGERTERTLKFVTELTDVYVWKDYPQWNRQKRKQLECGRMATISPGAQTIKYADIIDNCSEITTQDPGFAGKYLEDCRHLLSVIPAGHPELYHKASAMIREKLNGLSRNKKTG